MKAPILQQGPYALAGLTIAVRDMNGMVKFYQEVFDVVFEKQSLAGSELFRGQWMGTGLLLCPAELANNTATQNRHQFDILVDDLDAVRVKILSGGGTVFNTSEDRERKTLSAYDPDKNSIVFIQEKA